MAEKTVANGGGPLVVVESSVNKEAFNIALRTGQRAEMPNGIDYVVIPKDCDLVSLEKHQFSDYRETPHRKKASELTSDAASFLAYWNLFHNEHSLAFSNEKDSRIVGIIDYHHAGDGPARWCQHRITLQLTESEEWALWKKNNGRAIPQVEFGEFIEDNASDIVNPTPAVMLEVARDLVAKTDVNFESKVNSQNGQTQFTFRENLQASVGTGRIDVPQTFTILVPIFTGMDPITVEARLRFRINSGKLSFSYHLLYPSRKQRDAFRKIRRLISDGIGRETINQ